MMMAQVSGPEAGKLRPYVRGRASLPQSPGPGQTNSWPEAAAPAADADQSGRQRSVRVPIRGFRTGRLRGPSAYQGGGRGLTGGRTGAHFHHRRARGERRHRHRTTRCPGTCPRILSSSSGSPWASDHGAQDHGVDRAAPAGSDQHRISRRGDLQQDGYTVVASLDAALDVARASGADEAMVIGGAQIYAQAMPLAQRLYVTEVHAAFDGDAHFPARQPRKTGEATREPSRDRGQPACTWITYSASPSGKRPLAARLRSVGPLFGTGHAVGAVLPFPFGALFVICRSRRDLVRLGLPARALCVFVAALCADGRVCAVRSAASRPNAARPGPKPCGIRQRGKTMAQTMKAAVAHAFGEPLSIEEVEIPEVGPGQILVRVEASGVCHTDLHAVDGDWPVKWPALHSRTRRRRDGRTGGHRRRCGQGRRQGRRPVAAHAVTASTAFPVGRRCAIPAQHRLFRKRRLRRIRPGRPGLCGTFAGHAGVRDRGPGPVRGRDRLSERRRTQSRAIRL